jgi:3-oxoacyl-[acyl-carrier protein] reductase
MCEEQTKGPRKRIFPMNEPIFQLAGRVALITGAGRGIGRAIALVFAQAGARIVVATRTEAAGRETVDLVRAIGGEAVLVTADVGSPSVCHQLVEEAACAFGRLDIVLHNAAIFPSEAIEHLQADTLDATLAINLKSAFWLTKAALPHLRRSQAPRLLFTSSVTGPRVALPGLAHYAASKAGLNGFIRSAAMEFAAEGITVNGVEPGLIRTEALEALGDDVQLSRMQASIPLKRFGRPEEIAYAMLFLASDQAAFITGQTIIVDGGALLPENRLD